MSILAARKLNEEFRYFFELFSFANRRGKFSHLSMIGSGSEQTFASSLNQATLKASYHKLLKDYSVPFVAHISSNGGKYVVISQISENEVEIVDEEEVKVKTKSGFLKSWTGIVMRIEETGQIIRKDFSLGGKL